MSQSAPAGQCSQTRIFLEASDQRAAAFGVVLRQRKHSPFRGFHMLVEPASTLAGHAFYLLKLTRNGFGSCIFFARRFRLQLGIFAPDVSPDKCLIQGCSRNGVATGNKQHTVWLALQSSKDVECDFRLSEHGRRVKPKEK